MSVKYVDGTFLDNGLTSIANAIRTKTGSSSTMSFPAGFVSEIEGISGGEGENDLITRTISGTYENSKVTSIGSYALVGLPQTVTSVSFDNCVTINQYAFLDASMGNISFPKCVTIERYAFRGCRYMYSVSFPECTIIGSNAFNACLNLCSINFPKCTEVGEFAFTTCMNLVNVFLPECERILSNAFVNCNMSSINLPKCKALRANAFSSCDDLAGIYIPEVNTIGDQAFRNCIKLSSISILKIRHIGNGAFCSCYSLSVAIASFEDYKYPTIMPYAFSECYNLLSVYLLASSMYKLSASNAFTSTPIIGYTASTSGVYGSIFVPAGLYDAYISSTNWSFFSSRFVSLTDAQISNVLASGTHL